MAAGRHTWLVARGLAGTALAAALLVVAMGGLSPVLAAKRIKLYGADGQYTGYAVLDRQEGRVDYYDVRERRIGWAHVNRFSEHYRVDLFAANGMATGHAIVRRDTGRVEFFDVTSRPIGSGLIDKKGRVSATDLSGQRRDIVLPLTPRAHSALQGPSGN